MPENVCDYVLRRMSITRTAVEGLTRHDPVLVAGFQSVYGYGLERCSYANVRDLPDFFIPFYSIVRVECYRNIFFPENIEIDVHSCLNYYRDSEYYEEVFRTIQSTVKPSSLCFVYKGYIFIRGV